MLHPLMKEPDVMETVTFFLNDFKNKKLANNLNEYLLSAGLLALEKPGSVKPRLVAVGELFYRIVTSLSVDSLSTAAADILTSIQLRDGIVIRINESDGQEVGIRRDSDRYWKCI